MTTDNYKLNELTRENRELTTKIEEFNRLVKQQNQEITRLNQKNGKLVAEIEELIKLAVQQDQEKEALEKMAMISTTAGIYNLNFVNSEVERIKAIKERELSRAKPDAKLKTEYIFMFFIDIDGLKAINTAHGHAIGNAVLRKMGSVLESIVRRCDIAAHLHGDEFVVIAMSEDRSEGKKLKRRILEAISLIQLDENIAFSASAGFRAAILNPKFSFKDMMRKADDRMYEEKQKKEGARN